MTTPSLSSSSKPSNPFNQVMTPPPSAFITPVTSLPSLTPKPPKHLSSRRRTHPRFCLASSTTPISPTSPSPAPISAPISPQPPVTPAQPRTATISRNTRETSITVSVNLDGTGKCDVDTGIPFLDHMLHQLSSHGLLDLHIRAQGDLWIDDHHTNEDVAITLGMAIARALGGKKGIRRFGHFVAPLDESLVEVVLDFSGRPHVEYGLNIPTEKVGKYDTELVREFYMGLASNAQITLHVIQRAGLNSHHIIEASFKSFARAMRMAIELDPRRLDSVPSSKGVLTDDAALGPNN